jgi:hypothetical protein
VDRRVVSGDSRSDWIHLFLDFDSIFADTPLALGAAGVDAGTDRDLRYSYGESQAA